MANNLSKLRKEKKLTSKALAAKMGLSENYVYLLERKKALAAEHRNKLAQILGVKADDIAPVDEKAIIRTRSSAPRVKASGKGGDIAALVENVRGAVQGLSNAIGGPELEVLGLMARMPPSQRQTLLSLTRSLAKS